MAGVCAALCVAQCAAAQTAPLDWLTVRARFEAANPTLRAGQINIEESKAAEITANLRPNPAASFLMDQLQPFSFQPYRPLTAAMPLISLSYLHERNHQRELRKESAQGATAINESQQADLIRTLLFSVRSAFVQTLQAKAVMALAKENLDYFDRELEISRERYRAGDIAELDLNRLQLQRVQYESDYQSALVNLRTSKIQLQQLINDRSAVDSFDVTGPYDFSDRLPALEDLRRSALDARPDLKAAAQAIEKAQTDHKLAVANGSTDPTFTVDAGHNPPLNYFGVGVQVPVRIFDRNQGEKLRTQLDITHAERVRDATQLQVFHDVDSAYATLQSTLDLLKPYRDTYLKMATSVRDTTEFSYQHGQAALVDYLDAQRDYRATYLAYLNLVGSYLTAVSQLNLAVGREAIP